MELSDALSSGEAVATDDAPFLDNVTEGDIGGRGISAPSTAALASALLLAACGDGGGGSTGTTSAPVTVTTQAVTQTQASRFLGQATMGATKAMIADVVAKGYDGWLTAQFATARTTTHWDWLVANGYNAVANINSQAGFDATIWRGMIADPDQLRQRVGMALLDYLVVGISGTNIGWPTFATAGYIDVLLDNAFTNYRQIMDAITFNAGMSTFLTYLNNRKANTATGAQPDENYARELMQLFTLGLYNLNIDGTTAGSTPTETYTQADVSGLARVFTGLSLSGSTSAAPDPTGNRWSSTPRSTRRGPRPSSARRPRAAAPRRSKWRSTPSSRTPTSRRSCRNS